MVAVGADRDGIEGLARAERAGVPTFVHRVKDHAEPRGVGRGADRRPVASTGPTWSCSAGFMKLIGAGLPGRVRGPLRQHPPGAARRPSRACTAPADALAYGVKVTGATLFVVDAGVDTGPIVAQAAVPVEDDDDVDSLHERIKVAERAMLVDDRRPDGPRGVHRSPTARCAWGPRLARLVAHDWRRWATTRE